MASDKGRALPKFGDWDVNDPTSAEGFTVIFSKASDEKRTTSNGPAGKVNSQRRNNKSAYKPNKKRKWFCLG